MSGRWRNGCHDPPCGIVKSRGKKPNWGNTALAGVLLGVAQASKFSMLSLYPSWITLWLFYRIHARLVGESVAGWRPIAAILLISLATLNAAYRFEGTLSGYPVLIACNLRYLNGTTFFDASGLNNLSMR